MRSVRIRQDFYNLVYVVRWNKLCRMANARLAGVAQSARYWYTYHADTNGRHDLSIVKRLIERWGLQQTVSLRSSCVERGLAGELFQEINRYAVAECFRVVKPSGGWQVGTSCFKTMAALRKYYKSQEYDLEAIKEKVATGQASVGPPDCGPGDTLGCDQDGRYFINCPGTESGGRSDSIPDGDRSTEFRPVGAKAVSDDVRSVLSRLRWDDAACVISEQLDQKLYRRVNDVLEACGGIWNKKSKTHRFGIDGEERVYDVVTCGYYVPPANELKASQYFPTPVSVGERLFNIFNLYGFDANSTLLEPSAGDGALVRLAIKRGFSKKNVACVERDPAMAEKLTLDGFTTQCADFLTVQPSQIYSHIAMNPPFRLGQDIEHVLHAMQFLSPGGQLAAIMSYGIMFRTDRRTVAFREFLRQYGQIEEELEAGEFKESGTMVRTIMISLRKPDDE